MKTVKLTQAEIDVILTALDVEKICEERCYCGYKEDLCNALDKNGRPKCKLKQTIDIINKVLT